MSSHRVPVAVALLLVACGCSSQPTTASPAASNTTTGATGPTGPASAAPSPRGHPTEFNPPGDIPDNQVFVDYRMPQTSLHIRVPEGWARSGTDPVVFTDHFNSIALSVRAAARPPTVASAHASEVPGLRAQVARFARPAVRTVQRQHGRAVLITYLLDSAPDRVTGKVVRDAAERYEFWRRGQEAVLTLTGPRNADNVDPWRLVSDSLRWR